MRSFPARATVFVGGVLLCSWCYLLVADTRLGSSPLFVFEEGISTVTGVPFGVVTIATGVFFVSSAMALSAPVGPGTLVVPALFGFGVSVMGPLVPHLSGTAIRVGAFLIATHLMMLGAALIVCASYGAAATDAVMMGIARMSRRSHARVRTAMEITFTLLGVSLGGRAGLGTAVAAVTVGHSFDLWARILPAPAQKHPAKVSPAGAGHPGKAARDAGYDLLCPCNSPDYGWVRYGLRGPTIHCPGVSMPSPTRTNPTRWLVASLLPVALFAGACSDVDDSASSDTGAEDAAAASDEAATDEAAQEDAAEATDTPADEGESDSPEAEAAAMRGGDPMGTPPGEDTSELNIAQIAAGTGDVSTLTRLVIKGGLLATLRDGGPFTVLAPTNEAFAAIPPATLSAVSADPAQLTTVLTLHVIPGELTSEDLIALDGQSVEAVEGSRLAVAVDGETITVGGATVIAPDVTASNGVIHLVDSVITEPNG